MPIIMYKSRTYRLQRPGQIPQIQIEAWEYKNRRGEVGSKSSPQNVKLNPFDSRNSARVSPVLEVPYTKAGSNPAPFDTRSISRQPLGLKAPSILSFDSVPLAKALYNISHTKNVSDVQG
jgi:hypothetical protein